MKLLYPLLFAFSFAEDISEDIIQRYATGEKKVLVKYQGKGSSEKLIERIIYSLKGDTLAIEYPLDSYMKLFWDSENDSEYSNPLYKLVEVGYSIEHLNLRYELLSNDGITIKGFFKNGALDGDFYVINSVNDTLDSKNFDNGVDVYEEARHKLIVQQNLQKVLEESAYEEARHKLIVQQNLQKVLEESDYESLLGNRFKSVDGDKKTYWEFSDNNYGQNSVDITIRGRGIKRESYHYKILYIDSSTFQFIEPNDTITFHKMRTFEFKAYWKDNEYIFKKEDI
tara:strand:+ start:41 stop:889 length:849 start_codon:yes stop_codon:yes gene_type:complete